MVNWRGAFVGVLVGTAVAGIAWYAHGLFIGLSNDYSWYRSYDPVMSFWSKFAFCAPIGGVLGAWLGSRRA